MNIQSPSLWLCTWFLIFLFDFSYSDSSNATKLQGWPYGFVTLSSGEASSQQAKEPRRRWRRRWKYVGSFPNAPTTTKRFVRCWSFITITWSHYTLSDKTVNKPPVRAVVAEDEDSEESDTEPFIRELFCIFVDEDIHFHLNVCSETDSREDEDVNTRLPQK